MTDMAFPKLMGILNVTPDSFSDGGMFYSHDEAIKHGLELIEDGADILDVGGESTRPGSAAITVEEEIRRVIPVIQAIKKERPDTVISIDTTKLEAAKAAIDEGAEIINDISGLRFEPELARLAAENDLSLVLMHIQGTPRNMQVNPHYDNVVEEIFAFLNERIELASQLGVKKIIADVGIGFGKTIDHNLELLRNHRRFAGLGVPLLLGISRKAFIGKITGIENPLDRDLPTALLHALMLNSKADIIRIHNVKYLAILKNLFLSLNK